MASATLSGMDEHSSLLQVMVLRGPTVTANAMSEWIAASDASAARIADCGSPEAAALPATNIPSASDMAWRTIRQALSTGVRTISRLIRHCPSASTRSRRFRMRDLKRGDS